MLEQWSCNPIVGNHFDKPRIYFVTGKDQRNLVKYVVLSVYL